MGNKVRIGKDFTIRWALMTGEGEPYAIKREAAILKVYSPYGVKEAAEFKVAGNVIEWVFKGKEQKHLGDYTIELVENNGKDGMLSVDSVDAFTLVAHTEQESLNAEGAVEVQTMELTSQIALAPIVEPGAPPYDDTKIKQDIADLQEKDKATDAELAKLSEEINPIITLNPTEVVNGFITKTNGKLSSTTTFYATNYIDVSSVAGKTCKIKSTIYGYAALAFYSDANESSYISDYSSDNIGSLGYEATHQEPVERELLVPAKAKYARLSASVQYYEGLENLYIKKTNSLNETIEEIQTSINEVKEELVYEEVINPSNLNPSNGFISKNNGKFASATGYYATDYIDVSAVAGMTCKIKSTIYGYAALAFYSDANEGSYISDYSADNIGGLGYETTIQQPEERDLLVPVNAKYARMSVFAQFYNGLDDLYFKYKGTIKDAILTLEQKIENNTDDSGHSLLDKKVIVIGDSISTDILSVRYFNERKAQYPEYAEYPSYGEYNKWVYALTEKKFFPLNVENNSIHATGFVRRLGNYANDFVSRLKKIENPSSYDFVIVFGGINDFIGAIPLGENESDINAYFKPAVDEFFKYLCENFINARIVVFTPLRTSSKYPNTAGYSQQEYSQYIKEVAENYTIPVLDLTKQSGFMPFVETFMERWTFHGKNNIFPKGDGVHPNAEYEANVLAPLIKNYLKGFVA
jgi:lysophospholipase L1-like esterase